jgi:hypothetical protein
MRRLLLMMTTLSLLLLSGISSVAATSGSGSFHWDAGAGVVCGVEPTACPNVAMASNGDTIKVRAQGDMDTATDSATGSGTFQHYNSAGTLIASGTITANQLITFSFYGCASPPVPSNFCGGRAALAVHLVAHPASNPSVTVQADGILEVECVIGSPPPGANEGIRLNVQDRINYNKSVSGDTLFIKM